MANPSNPGKPGPVASRDPEFDDPAMRGLAGGPTAPLKLKQPAGLRVLFMVEMWERFSFYGMKALLVIFMIKATTEGGLAWDKHTAGAVMGWYSGLVYLTPIIGGFLADRWLGTHRSMLIGGTIIAAGHFTLMLNTVPTLFTGLTLVIIGTGFFKSNVSTMVGQMYGKGDPRRDAGFTIFYMGINLGAFIAPLACGWLRTKYGWSWGFGAAGVGMVLGLIQYMLGRPKHLGNIGARPSQPGKKWEILAALGLGVLLMAVTTALSFPSKFPPVQAMYDFIGMYTVLAIGVPCIIALAAIGGVVTFVVRQTKDDRGPVATIFIMAFFVFFFWASFEQAGNSMSAFAEERTDRSTPRWLEWAVPAPQNSPTATTPTPAGASAAPAPAPTPSPPGPPSAKATPPARTGYREYPAEWFQSVNACMILFLAPVAALIWIRLARIRLEPSTPLKMAMGLILVGVGFILMVGGAQISDGGVRVGAWWLIGAFFVHTIAELCLSPVGLSLVTKLAPLKFASLLMGVWFLANFFANMTAGRSLGLAAKFEEGHGPFHIFGGQADFFFIWVAAPIAAGLVLCALIPVLKKMMHGRA